MRIELKPGPLPQVLSSSLQRKSLSIWPVIGKRNKCVSHTHDPSRQGNLFSGQGVGIPHTVPPFVMPPNDQLGSAVSAGTRHFLFTKNRVTTKVDQFIIAQGTIAFNVFAAHR